MSEVALAKVKNTSPRQTWAFVCSSRRKDAQVVDAMICYDTAKRAARAIGGCMRVGHVDGVFAETV